MNERLKKLRKSLDMTQQEFADKLQIKRNTVATYEMGRSEPSGAGVALICSKFNVNENWLRTGEGEMFKKVDRNEDLARLTKMLLDEEPDSFKNRFVTMMSNLSESEWEFLEKKAQELAGQKKEDL